QEDSAYSTGSYSPPPPGAEDPQYFPQTNYFPPPPTQPVDYSNNNNNYPPYNPADYPPPNNGYSPSNAGHIHPATGYTPPPPEPGNPYAHQDPRYRRPDDNVSARDPPLPEHVHASRFDRLGAQHANSPIHNVPSPIHSASRETETTIQPEPVKPASEKSV
ncbi:uncharacterized protein CC84DRAFT_1191955, partial [Paraphaeosphaeria sporulosa]